MQVVFVNFFSSLCAKRMTHSSKQLDWLYSRCILRPVANFSNILCATFTHADPKSAKKTVNLSNFLRFWDLHTYKLCVNMLMTLTPVVNFTNILLTSSFFSNLLLLQKHVHKLAVQNKTLSYQKSARKMLIKLAP